MNAMNIGIVVFIIAILSIGVYSIGMKKDSQFDKVLPNSMEEYECSPKIKDVGFQGIKLSAPSEVYFDSVNFSPVICGIYSLKYDTMGLNGNFIRSIKITAIDVNSGEIFSGNMEPVGSRHFATPYSETIILSHEELKNRIITEYFNPNLETSISLPKNYAEYEVFAELGEYKSNTVRISVKEK